MLPGFGVRNCNHANEEKLCDGMWSKDRIFVVNIKKVFFHLSQWYTVADASNFAGYKRKNPENNCDDTFCPENSLPVDTAANPDNLHGPEG